LKKTTASEKALTWRGSLSEREQVGAVREGKWSGELDGARHQSKGGKEQPERQEKNAVEITEDSPAEKTVSGGEETVQTSTKKGAVDRLEKKKSRLKKERAHVVLEVKGNDVPGRKLL